MYIQCQCGTFFFATLDYFTHIPFNEPLHSLLYKHYPSITLFHSTLPLFYYNKPQMAILFSSPLLLLPLILLAFGGLAPRCEARAFYVFGDSLVDNGNNNYLATSARADSPPYGIDYPSHHPTGRFSNGLNIPDIISQISLVISCNNTVYKVI